MDEQQINPTHSFELADVEKYGSIEKALLMKELRGMQVYKQRNNKSGWVYYSGAALEDKFPYMNARSIRRRLTELVEDGYLETAIKNKTKYDQTKSYRVKDLSTSGQNDQSSLAKITNDNGHSGQPIPSHSPPHSTSQSKDWSFEQKREYAKACERDRALERREAGRASPSTKGSFGSVVEIMGVRPYVQKSIN